MAGVTDSGYRGQLTFLRSPCRLGAAVTLRKLFNPAGRIDEFLFARKKRMASSADADSNVLARRTRVIDGAARTSDIGHVILWMNACFHVWKGARNLLAPSGACKR